MTNTLDGTIGGRIAGLRKKKNKTQVEMAKDLNLTRNTISKWEANIQEIKGHDLVALAKYFNVSCDEILTGNTPEYVQLSNELGLSSEAISALEYFGRASNFYFNDNITAKDLGENAQLYEKISKEKYNEYAKKYPMALPEYLTALSALNYIVESDYFISFFCNIYNYFNFGKLEQIRLNCLSKKNGEYQNEEIGAFMLKQTEAPTVDILDEQGRCIRLFASQVKELTLAKIIGDLNNMAKATGRNKERREE